MPLKLYNTRTRAVEEFSPIDPGRITMYNCGPTVYNFAHIGNLRAYVFADVLRRAVEREYGSGGVRQVINITDVGHLVSDADEGEDKMVVGAAREGKSIEEIIALYSDAFYDDLAALNVRASADRGKEEYFPRATHHIPQQVALIQRLEKGGYTYVIGDGVYFDTGKFPTYADFARLDIAGMREGARVETNTEKRNPTDFALWKFSPKDGKRREQEWESPWGKGFPGWHIECSAMSREYLGQPFDIHTGGIDHIPVHHTNEIAQSEAAYDVPLANFWLHSAHMTVNGEKMSKSLRNTFLLSDLRSKRVPPLAFRYWLLTASYRTKMNFTWDALKGSAVALERLRSRIHLLDNRGAELTPREFELVKRSSALAEFSNDLDTASVIALLWGALENPAIPSLVKLAVAKEADAILGLDLLTYSKKNVEPTDEVRMLLEQRMRAREQKNFAESDRLREEIGKRGYAVKDTPDGQRLELPS